MNTLYDTLLDDIKKSMKNKETDKKNVLKQVQTKVQAEVKEKKADLTDELVIKSIEKEIKQLNQTKTSLAGHEDSELFKSTEYKINVLSTYLPKKLTEEEVEKVMYRLLKDDMSLSELIKKAKMELGIRADGATIAKVAKKWLK